MVTTAYMIYWVFEKMNNSKSELSRCIGQTPQNFSKKLKRGTVSFEKMMAITKIMSIGYE